ncbi:MAG: lactate utilization protein [Desulfobacterales bacterium]|nr:lactate utilization protein [Desulfobacterales bacterium]
MKKIDIKEEFVEKASLVSAIVHEVKSIDEAFSKTIDICKAKKPREDLVSLGTMDPLFDKIVAAPGLDDSSFSLFDNLGKKSKISLVNKGLRCFPGGIDIGFTLCDYGIAQTGTLVLNSDSEDMRLATMLCEIHVAMLHVSRLRETANAMSEELTKLTAQPSSYTAFITGASRTADIERVLAIGVHGPLELHIMLMEG